jgi:hypothetical protein
MDKQWIAQEQLQMVEDVVLHFRSYDNIVMWQVENEPFLTTFGVCPDMPLSLFKQEVALVKSLDQRPILITDSGELSFWLKTAGVGDKFGHTLYRLVYNDYLGYLHYYMPPIFYRAKAWLVGLEPQDIIIAELQAEPWVATGYSLQLDYEKMLEVMNKEKVESNLNYAKKVGANEVYFWGAEWWYWLKTEKNNTELWDFARAKIAEYP